MIQEFVAAVVRHINEEIERKQLHSAEGGCRSWDEYKHLTGEIQGLLRARLYITDLAKKAEKDDDIDD